MLSVEKRERQIIIHMPKIELHLHLEGAFTFDFLLSLINKYGGDPSVESEEQLKKKFVFRNFEHFLNLWFWKNKFFREAEDFEKCAYTTLKNLSHQNVIYSELFYSPWDFLPNGLSIEEITEATLSGIKQAEKEFQVSCNLIADIVRDHDHTKAVERVEQIIPYKDKGIVGIGLGGSEQLYPAGLFKDAFKRAAQSGFRLTAHAGEAAGPESVWEAIRLLDVERIGHGVRSIEDPVLISYLKKYQIPLEICVMSNLKTKIYSSLQTHPIKYFLEKKLKVTVNSDDPAMFGASITEELLHLFKELHLNFNEMKLLTINALESAFTSSEVKEKIKKDIDMFWKNYTN